jgi:hypothetical protein
VVPWAVPLPDARCPRAERHEVQALVRKVNDRLDELPRGRCGLVTSGVAVMTTHTFSVCGIERMCPSAPQVMIEPDRALRVRFWRER